MKKPKEKFKYGKKGITLIALVITIIVLLILAAVSIVTLTGENGILTRANEAKQNTEIAEEKEKMELSVVGALSKDNGGEIKRKNLNDELASYIGVEGKDYTLSEFETAPFVVTYSESGRSYLIDENGNISEYEDISEYVKVGQYVNYNPTMADKNGNQVEESKLRYISPTGSGTEHGNGYESEEEEGGQTYTAKESTKWRVLSIESGRVELISEEPIKKDEINQDDGNFVMSGAVGYLYAERELNEICKIYGYGYGADTSHVTEYSYGGPLDGELTEKITGSGARSITVEDIDKKAGISTEEDYKAINGSYGSTTNPTVDIWYPTITTPDGSSGLAGVKNLKNTYYTYDKSKISNLDMQNMLFNGNYWLASYCIDAYSSSSNFSVRRVNSNDMQALGLCNGETTKFYVDTYRIYAVRPVVILKSNFIDTSTKYETEGHWNLK